MSEQLEEAQQVAQAGLWSVWIGQNDMLRRQVDECDEIIFITHKVGDSADKWLIGMSKIKPERIVGVAMMTYDKAAEAGLVPPRTWGPDKQTPQPNGKGMTKQISIPLTPEVAQALMQKPPETPIVPE